MGVAPVVVDREQIRSFRDAPDETVVPQASLVPDA
jgi:hypothetical protein